MFPPQTQLRLHLWRLVILLYTPDLFLFRLKQWAVSVTSPHTSTRCYFHRTTYMRELKPSSLTSCLISPIKQTNKVPTIFSASLSRPLLGAQGILSKSDLSLGPRTQSMPNPYRTFLHHMQKIYVIMQPFLLVSENIIFLT